MRAVVITVLTRIALALVSWMSLRAFPRFSLYPTQLPDNFLPDHPFFDGWARWDAAHFIAVARLGYGDPSSPSPNGGLGFFPAYPLLMRAAVAVSGATDNNGAYAVAGIVIANLCFLVAVALIAQIAFETAGDSVATNTVLLICLAPFSLFFSAAYSESLFLLFSVTSLWFGRRERWVLAGLAAGLASATRLVGLALLPSLLLLAWRGRAKPRDLLTVALLATSGLIAYFTYTGVKFHDFFAYFDTQAEWGGWEEHVHFYAVLFAKHPRDALFGDPRHLVIVLNVALLVVYLALLPMTWRLLDPGTALFCTLLVVAQGVMTWVSLGRYLMPAFGIAIVAGVLLTRPRLATWPRDLVFAGSAMLLALLTVLFAHGFWVV